MNEQTFYYIFTFLLGTVFGSFYNVVIYRLPAQMPIAKGRSMCFSCKHRLGVLDLVPLLSYIFLRGRCRYCKAKFSSRYFIIELLTGLLFLFSALKFGLNFKAIATMSFFSCLIIVAMIDLDTYSIYDIVLIIFAVITGGLLMISGGIHTFARENLLGALIGFVIYYLIYFVSKIIYKQVAFGFGDVLLNLYIGLYLGRFYILISSFFSFIVALIFIIIFSLMGKKYSSKTQLPFGPYMCLSAFIMIFFGESMVNFYIKLAFG